MQAEPRFHVRTLTGYTNETLEPRARPEVDAYVMDRAYLNKVVATFRKRARGNDRPAKDHARQYVRVQAQAVADILNALGLDD